MTGQRLSLPDQTSGPRALAANAFGVVAWLFVAGLVVQVFLAGLGVFDSPARFVTHRDFGYMLTLLPVVLAVLGLVARLPRRLVLLAVLAFVLVILQSVFVALRSTPAIAALHPVNGFAILLVAVAMARGAWLPGRRTER